MAFSNLGSTTAKPTPKKPAPAKPTPAFSRPAAPQTPFAPQQRAAAKQTAAARAKLPAAPIAAPPRIPNPTPTQVKTAKAQIVASVRAAVGPGGSPEDRQARRDQLLKDVQTQPRYAQVRASLDHWNAASVALDTPQSKLMNQLDRVAPGKAPSKLKLGVGPVVASVNLTAAEQALANHLPQGPEAKFGGNALSDVAHLPLMVPQTAYQVGRAALDLTHGNVKPAKALVKGFTEGLLGHVARGDWNGAVDYFRDHPVYAMLELVGGKAVAGRTAGAVMRSGVAGETAARLASTAREDANLAGETGSRVASRQHYSPDVVTKLAQVAAERSGVTKVLTNHRLRRRADFESDMAASTSRAVRSDEAHKTVAAKPTGPAANVVGLVVQGVVRPAHAEADMHKELARLDAAHEKGEFSTVAQRKQNRTTADAIRKVLATKNPAATLAGAVVSGRENISAINQLEQHAIDLGAITPARAARAKLFPAAQAHLDAERSDAPFRAARGREVQAGRELRTARAEIATKVQKAQDYEETAATRVQALATLHRSERGKEAHHGPVAAYYVGPHRFTLRSDAEAFSKLKGTDPKTIRRVALTKGEAERVGSITQARRVHEVATSRRREAEAELRTFDRRSREGTSRGPQAIPERAAFDAARGQRKAAAKGGAESLHAPGGERLTNEEIRAAVGEDVAYLPHHTNARGARAYYQTAFNGRKNLDSAKARTGEAFAKGAVDQSYQAVLEHRVRLRGVVNRIAEHDRMIHSMAVKGPGGKMFTWDQAEKLAENAREKGSKLVPYRAVPGSYDKERIAKIADSQDAAETPDLGKLVGHEFEERLKAPAAADRSTPNVVLLPEQIVNQLKEQQTVAGTSGRLGNVATDVFRRTTLPFSSKWLTGNVVEAGLRLAAVGAGPNAYRIGRAMLNELDSIDHEQALRVRGALTGGLLYGNKGLTVRRLAEHFEGTSLATPAKLVGTVGHLPVVHQLSQLMKHYTDAVFKANHAMESIAQTTALGKYAKREMQSMTGSWAKATKAQQGALHDIANGMMHSKNIEDAARYIDETLGQYSRFSPALRKLIQQYTPFLPWYLASARWLLYTLPAKHPIKSGLYALTANNLQADYDASHKDLPPGDLMGDLVANGKPYPSGRYTPFGAFAPLAGGGNEQLEALVDPLFPQFKSAFLAAFGLNFAGRAAKIDPASRTDGDEVPLAVRASMAVNSLLEAFVPVLATGRGVEEGGKTPYDNSTVWRPETKPGTRVSGGFLNRRFNPFRPTNLNPQQETVVSSPGPASSSSTPQAPADPWDAVDAAQASTPTGPDPWEHVK